MPVSPGADPGRRRVTAPAALQVGDLTVCPDTTCGDVAEVVDVYELDGAGGSAVHVVTVCLWRHRYHQIT